MCPSGLGLHARQRACTVGMQPACAALRHVLPCYASLGGADLPLLQLAPFTCLNLGHLRPVPPVAPRPVTPPEQSAEDSEGSEAPSAPPVPALTAATIHLGSVYDFNILASADRSGQRARYVPALVVSKRVMADLCASRAGDASDASDGGQTGGQVDGRRRGIASVLQQLRQRRDDAAPAPRRLLSLTLFWPGACAAAKMHAAPLLPLLLLCGLRFCLGLLASLLALQGSARLHSLCCPACFPSCSAVRTRCAGCRDPQVVQVAEEELSGPDAPLRPTCWWEPTTGAWKLWDKPQPTGPLSAWRRLGLTGALWALPVAGGEGTRCTTRWVPQLAAAACGCPLGTDACSAANACCLRLPCVAQPRVYICCSAGAPPPSNAQTTRSPRQCGPACGLPPAASRAGRFGVGLRAAAWHAHPGRAGPRLWLPSAWRATRQSCRVRKAAPRWALGMQRRQRRASPLRRVLRECALHAVLC